MLRKFGVAFLIIFCGKIYSETAVEIGGYWNLKKLQCPNNVNWSSMDFSDGMVVWKEWTATWNPNKSWYGEWENYIGHIFKYDGGDITQISIDSVGEYDYPMTSSGNAAWCTGNRMTYYDGDTQTTQYLTDGTTSTSNHVTVYGDKAAWTCSGFGPGHLGGVWIYDGETVEMITDMEWVGFYAKLGEAGLVWEGHADFADSEIYFYDGNFHKITDNDTEDSAPQISGHYLTWLYWPTSNNYGLQFYDLQTETLRTLEEANPDISVYQSKHSMWNNEVVWYNGENIKYFDGQNINTITSLESGGVSTSSIGEYGIVWAQSNGDNTDIYYYDRLVKDILTDININDSYLINPIISGNRVAWTSISPYQHYFDRTFDFYIAQLPTYTNTFTVDDDGPADYCTIQEAINTANNGDRIVVLQGHYYENIDFRGKSITLTSLAPCDPCVVQDTVIDADGNGIAVSFHMAEDLNSVISGFTIKGGNASYGAGICCWNDCSPRIRYCTIEYNQATKNGGGIYCAPSSDPAVESCHMENNTAQNQGGGIYCCEGNPVIFNCIFNSNSADEGGGIYSFSASPKIQECTFSNNSTQSYGGGVYTYSGEPEISYCTLQENSANEGGGLYSYRNNLSVKYCTFLQNQATCGGGIFCMEESPVVSNSLFICNTADYGGGIYFSLTGTPVVKNSVIHKNTAIDGGGIYVDYYSSALLTNNIICSNEAGSGVFVMYSNPILAYNDIFGNTPFDYAGWAWPGEGDISVDPCFVDSGYWDDNGTPGDPGDDFWVDGDYHLHYDSLCINAGDPCFVADPCEMDMDGQSRIRFGRVDMGVDEAGSNPADFNENGTVDLIDYSVLISDWRNNQFSIFWNPKFDIAEPKDGVIDILDLAVFCDQWLWQAHGLP